MSSTSPTDEQWKLASALVAAFNDMDCRCDRITLTEGAKENLRIKVAYALRQREQEVRAEGWQPIESAPRDGTPILIGFPNGQVQQHILKPETVKAVWFPGGNGPTHWRPIPVLPMSLRRDDTKQKGEQL